MNGGWTVVFGAGLGTMAIKALAPALLGGRALPPRILGVLALLAPTLLAALIVTEAFGDERSLVIDARAAGLAAAIGALALRAPLLVVIAAAAAVAALVRALGLLA